MWNSLRWGLILWADTPEDSVIGCNIHIPSTSYTESRETVYHPGSNTEVFHYYKKKLFICPKNKKF